MKENMFYKANPLIFKRASELRNNLTPSESLLWNHIGQGQLGIKFRRQHPAANYVLGFYAHKVKLAIEIDGGIHNRDEVKHNDEIRQGNLEALGINFLRFTNQEVLSNIESVLQKIKTKMSTISNSPSGVGGMRIIPAIDIIEGKCVRLSKGDYNTKIIYNENPLEIAMQFEEHGIKHLHLVDLDGAKSKHIVNHKILEKIANKTKLKIDFGGGLKTDEDLRIAFESGANQITGGSIAVKDADTFKSWIKKFGSEKIILGADANNEKIAISGWQEESEKELIPFIKEYQSEGINYVICTDISKDGMLQGPSFELYKKILGETSNLKLIASGGISTFEELPKLAELGCEGTIIGKAIYENRITLKQLEHYILKGN